MDSTTTQDTQDIKNVRNKEVSHIIKNLKGRKSPGYGRISGKMIKELPPKAVRFITIVINAVFRLRYFPNQWKVAQIILIPKPGKEHELVTSYRPISLLPILSKMCDKVLLK